MNPHQIIPKNIDEYIAGFPSPIQEILESVRATIRNAAPESEEVISYRMPAFKQNGYVIFFAAHKKHLGMYGNTTVALEIFKEELATYVGPKGSLKFPYNKPMPLDIISNIVKLRVKENQERAEAK